MSVLNISRLCALSAPAQQQDQGIAVLPVVDPVSRTVINPQLTDPTADVLPIAPQAFREPVQSGNDAGAGGAVSKTVQPFLQGSSAISRLVLADFDGGHCSLKATNWKCMRATVFASFEPCPKTAVLSGWPVKWRKNRHSG